VLLRFKEENLRAERKKEGRIDRSDIERQQKSRGFMPGFSVKRLDVQVLDELSKENGSPFHEVPSPL
jgi:hypothetical protein